MSNIKHSKNIIQKATVSLVLDVRKKLDGDTYPVKLRVMFMRKFNRYAIGKYRFSKDDWETLVTTNPRGELKKIKIELNLIEGKAQDIVESMHDFTFEKFIAIWKGKTVTDKDLTFETCLKARISMYKDQDRVASAQNAQTVFNSFQDYFNGVNPDLRDLKPADFKKYQGKLLKAGKSPATVGIYTREVRTMYNDLIQQGFLEQKDYPFGKGGFTPPNAKKLKTAIMKEEIRKLIAYEANTLNSEAYCRDLWVFSYICNGINYKDIAGLRYQDIKGDFLFFKRAKTRRTKSTEETIGVPLLPLATSIIERWGNKNRKGTNYIFPILAPDTSVLDQRRLIQNTCRLIRDHIKSIAKKLDLNKKDLTANAARDAFATVSNHEGRPLSDISESLGHSSIAVTEHYLAGFSDASKAEWQKQLL